MFLHGVRRNYWKMTSLPVPEKLNLNVNNKKKEWEKFLQSWKCYEVATDLSSATEAKKIAILLTIIGSEGMALYNTFEWNNDAEKTVESILKKFESFCSPRRNETFERHIFMSCKQEMSEDVMTYMVKLKNLAESCEYGVMRDSIIRDVFILGLNNDTIRESLLRDNDLTLERAIDTALSFQEARNRIGKLRSGTEDNDINKLNGKENEFQNEMGTILCKFCNQRHVRNRLKCPAWKKTCNKCGSKNHFASVCKKL